MIVLILICVAMFAGCRQNTAGPEGGTSTATPGVNAEPPATPASTIEKTEGNDLQVTVSELYISQDFMPMVPASGPPLHALLTLAINGKDALRAAKGDASGTITITRPNGEIIARSNLTASRASDDLSLAQPGPQ